MRESARLVVISTMRRGWRYLPHCRAARRHAVRSAVEQAHGPRGARPPSIHQLRSTSAPRFGATRINRGTLIVRPRR
jgi:hypothetical protein